MTATGWRPHALRSAVKERQLATRVHLKEEIAPTQHDVSTGTVRWNTQFLDFAAHHGFLPVASPPYWSRVKGKIERGVGYIKESFLEGRSFSSLEDLNRQLETWLAEVSNVRMHGTTGERPVDRHVRELVKLAPPSALPPYDTRSLEIRRVSPDCHISYQGVFYSVDPAATPSASQS
jgi:hypothetical protein